jgi:hypothetical protein
LAVVATEARMSDEEYLQNDTLRSEDAASVAAIDKRPLDWAEIRPGINAAGSGVE